MELKSLSLFLGMVSCGVLGCAFGSFLTIKLLKEKILKKEREIYRYHSYYDMLRYWVAIKQEKEDIAKYLFDKGYKDIAIYGMGDIGNLFFDEFKNTCVNIKYGIDKNAKERISELEIVEPNKNMEKVDLIIVSAIFAFDEIQEMLNTVTSAPVIPMDDLIFEIKS